MSSLCRLKWVCVKMVATKSLHEHDSAVVNKLHQPVHNVALSMNAHSWSWSCREPLKKPSTGKEVAIGFGIQLIGFGIQLIGFLFGGITLEKDVALRNIKEKSLEKVLSKKATCLFLQLIPPLLRNIEKQSAEQTSKQTNKSLDK